MKIVIDVLCRKRNIINKKKNKIDYVEMYEII